MALWRVSCAFWYSEAAVFKRSSSGGSEEKAEELFRGLDGSGLLHGGLKIPDCGEKAVRVRGILCIEGIQPVIGGRDLLQGTLCLCPVGVYGLCVLCGLPTA